MSTHRWIILLCVIVLWFSATGCSDDENNPSDSTTTSDHTTHQTTTATTVPDKTTSTSYRTHTTTTTTTQPTTSTTRKTRITMRPTPPRPTVNISQLGSHLIDAPILAQMPEYPSGCESVSAVMMLQYWGQNITVGQFIDNYLPKSNHFYTENGCYYGPDPYEFFIGDPRTTQAYGCMAPVRERAINDYYGGNSPLQNVTGLTLPQLCKEYIANDQPVLVWVSIGMIEIYDSAQWYLDDGTLYTWPANEHCMMLVGYDDTYYYLNDPYTGKVKKYAHWICEDRYQTMGKQALVIVK